MHSRVIFVNPPFRPSKCGVSDFTSLLVDRLKPETTAIICCAESIDESIDKKAKVEFADLHWLSADNLRACDVIFVNYSGWGFHKYGVPIGLVKTLKKIGKRQRVSVFVYFHETWISNHGLISRNTLWKPAQRYCCKTLASLASASIVNSERNARNLASIGVEAVVRAPVPSNFEVKSFSSRDSENVALIFGRPDRRNAVIDRLIEYLANIKEQFAFDKLLLMGAGLSVDKSVVAEVERLSPFTGDTIIQVIGEASPEKVSEILSKTTILLTDYAPDEWGKSGSIQAAFQHGVCPGYLSGGALLTMRGGELNEINLSEDVMDFSEEMEAVYLRNANQFNEALIGLGCFE